MASPPPTAPRSRRSRLRLVAFAALGVAVSALTLSGCVSLKTVDAQQEGSIGAHRHRRHGMRLEGRHARLRARQQRPRVEHDQHRAGAPGPEGRLPVRAPGELHDELLGRPAALHGEPVLHGRADAALAARRRAQVGRLHLGRPHVHAGQGGHGASADHPPPPARWVSQRVRLRLQLGDRIARRHRAGLPGDASRGLRGRPHSGQQHQPHDLRGRGGRARRVTASTTSRS